MNIKMKEVLVKDIVDGFKDSQDEGVIGYQGNLNIRPKYQREFVYKDKQREAVINSVLKNFPLNVFYWVVNKDGSYEVLDGQQRTLSICQYVNGDFAVDYKYFHNLSEEAKEKILNYPLMVYFCEGNSDERLDWFQTINIAGEKLTAQELRNAVYAGTWLEDAKKYFSKPQGPAYLIGNKLVKGSPIRQDYLQTVLKWVTNDGSIEDYMALSQVKPNANDLRLYFESVVSWVNTIFTSYKQEMKGVDWGILYNQYKNTSFDSKSLTQQVNDLMLDDDVTSKPGIYSYLITKNEKHLSLRTFTPAQKRSVFEYQKGVCPICKNTFAIDDMEADHIDPWSKGGKTDKSNCQMLCKPCNRRKSSS